MLAEVFKEFDSIHKEYANKYSNFESGEFDLAYFYNERANVSIFAGAVWRQNPKNNLVLEEYSCDKDNEHPPENETNVSTYKGRRDLWFCLGESQFRCEAKQKWWSLDNLEEEKLISAIELAGVESSKVEKKFIDSKNTALGMVFVTLKIKRSNLENVSSYLVQLGNLIKKHQADNLYVHSLILDEVINSLGETSILYPGVLVFVKKA
ncbi:hypothetical protein D8T49_24440 [Vibrio vulnificus]|uniref:hypothetical protein n=3 Tax=Vibrio TaxID=662 RepID=UPI000C7D9029|nr:hypothetical protein [Vibrio vulnificus]EHK9578191.1 hypothetical protein [Vibrio parahaemolyticus]AUL95667.1 hypothetical protein FORC54_1522 [Vibrio vulnificus]EGQ7759766.1 hypothetical protein [Vibrio vulnificus]EGQ8079878.1 hypothetical protein [Vibrio vulnificus]EHD0099298.1 hypothetical protein [Vibrio vulnificus]